MHETATPRRPRWGRRLLIGLAALVAVLALVAGVAWVVKPWAPEVVVSDPLPGGRRVTDDGMLAHYYPARGDAQRPTVLVVGGSEGGLSPLLDRTASALQTEGFNALALAYWGAPGQPQAMDALPLETFTRALDWLRRQPEVDAGKLAFMGTSKGGEAAVLLASRTPELRAVVGYVPSNVVWAGLDLREPWRTGSIGSTWNSGGQPVPYLPYDAPGYRGGPLVGLYAESLTHLAEHPDAEIPVERSTAPLLLVCGEDDQLWPSCPMARSVQQRSQSRGGPEVTVLAYPDAGHLVSGPPRPEGDDADLTQLGGTQAGGTEALQDSWPKVVEFLGRHTR